MQPEASAKSAPAWRARRARRQLGMSLIEMMVVIAIIGLLASVAVPTFRNFVYKARRVEGMMGLRQLFQLQTSFYSDKGYYSDSFSDLGFSIDPGQLQLDGSYIADYYTYTLETWDVNGRPDANYRGTASGDIDPLDPILDIIVIENRLKIVQ
jgi:prepilin-type N-terminal cleavage/methylation domain-containing protein